MEHSESSRRSPSREACEKTIKRILMTEVLENGRNKHFKSAADFMNYFESLYPASDALTKQVQRAVKALDMPKDEHGYFIANKTVDQFNQESAISSAFKIANVSVDPMEDYETVFLYADAPLRSYLIHLLSTSDTFAGKLLTIVETYNGLIIYTKSRSQLVILLNSLTI